MNCPNCQQDNPQDANYCRNCGRLLDSACPRCQTSVIAESHFCHHCGLPVSPHGQSISWQEPPHSPFANYRPPAPDSLLANLPGQSPDPDALAANQPQKASAPALDRFLPSALADKLQAARTSGSMVGERRVVTMLFCDVQGSTAAAEKLDPEEWTDIINGAFEHMIKPVYKYEGIVARLMGDAILAFFGAPIAHEDDPQRAVLTGLEIIALIKPYQQKTLDRFGIEITVRVGINTGLVVVGAVGSDLRMEYTAMGDAINLAARMEQTAEPGTVQIAEPTHRLVKPLFDFEELGGVEVKGKDDPVPSYRVLRRKEGEQNLRGIESMRAPLIGRDREINSLHEILDSSQQRLGHIICLTGDAGLGKSRLIEEARQYWQGAGLSGNWQTVSSLSYETNHAYGLFQRLIRRLDQIAVTDSAATLRQKLEPLLAYFPDERRPRVMQLFETMFALESESSLPPLEGESFKGELFNVLLHIWSLRFAGQPTVLVFDDVHWSDPASVNLLAHLFTATDSMPLVLICAFRPDRDAPSAILQRTASENFSHRFTEIILKPLPDADINAILDELLAIKDLPEELRRNILERAAGNPFFVEEVVRGLILSGAVISEEKRVDGESRLAWRALPGAVSVDIPDNLHGLLAARIDRLEADMRATLQLASVIGRSFYERVLIQLAENSNGESPKIAQHLRRLLQLQMIQEATRIPEVEYIFRNPLTQEVAYNGILLKRRREFHGRVGAAMESLFSAQLTELSPRLAYHFEQARKPVKAFHYYLMAADQARHLYANEEALAHYNQALSLVDVAQASSEQLTRLYLHRGRVLEHAGDFAAALDNYQMLGNLGLEQDNKAMQLQALVASGTVRSMQDPLIAQQLAEEGLALAQELDDKAAEATIHWNLMLLANTRGQEGDDQLAVSHGQRSLALARAINLRSQMALTLNDLSAAYRSVNQTDQANESAREARALLRELGNLPMLADAYAQSSHFLSIAGEFSEAAEAATEAINISTAIGNLWNQASGAASMGFIELERGNLGAAISILSSVKNLAGMSRLEFLTAVVETRLAEAFIELRNLKTARLHAQKALEIGVGARVHTQQAAKGQLARICLLQGDLLQAQKEGLELESSTGSDSLFSITFSLPAWQYQLESALALENTEYAVHRAEETLALAEHYNMRIFLPVLRTLLAQALWQQGDETAARHALAEAEAITRAMGSRRYLWSILAQQALWAEDEETAEQLRAQARIEVNHILETITNPALRQSFLARQAIQNLMPIETSVNS